MVQVLKVYNRTRGGCEIRRVTITSEILNSYNLLCQKINALFPSLDGKTFYLSWKDSEDDDIVMSSDEELAHAVANADENMFKIYVHETSGNMPNGSPDRNVIHPHVVCDGCNGAVKGYRYKCLQCEDYDLCSFCNDMGVHPDHDMLKLASPTNQPHPWYFPGWRRLWESMFGFADPFHHGGATGGQGGFCHGRGGKGKTGGCPYFKGKCPRRKPRHETTEIMKDIGECVSSFLKPFGIDVSVDVLPSDSESEVPNSEKKSEKEPVIESEVTKETTYTTTNAAEGIQKESTSKINKENVDEVGQASPASSTCSFEGARPKSKLSSPFEYVSSRGSTPEKKTAGLFALVEDAIKTFADDWTIINNSEIVNPKTDEVSKNSETTPVVNQETISAATSEPKIQETTSAATSQPKIQETVSAATSQPKIQETISAATSQPQIQETISAAISEPQIQETISACQDDNNGAIPVVEEKASSAGNREAKGDAKSSSDFAQLTEDFFATLDPEVANALRNMLAMGFNNEGGWLSRLLQAKNGSISDVLDSLYRH